MKQIDEIPPQSLSRLYETPQKKQRPQRRRDESKANEVMLLEIEDNNKFDLSQSPRFFGSTEINPHGQSSIKHCSASQSHRKYQSPAMIKIQENEDDIPTPEKYSKHRNRQTYFEQKYGDLSVQENFMKCYNDIIQQISRGDTNVTIPTPEIFSPYYQDDVICSQLITFNLNPKNSRKLIYDQEKFTVVPVFECLGCRVQFENPSALGGHLSRCKKKQLHYERLDEYYRNCEIIQEKIEKDKKQFQFDRESQKLSQTPQKHKEFKEHQRDSSCFFYSSESKSVSKSVVEEKHYSDHQIDPELFNEEKDDIMEKSQKTLKKTNMNVYLSRNIEGKNKKIHKFTIRN